MKLLILGLMAKILTITILLSLAVALIYLGKQKVMASMQRRKGGECSWSFWSACPESESVKNGIQRENEA